MYNRKIIIPVFVFALLSFGACDMDIVNPNTATEDEVLSERDGLITLAVGAQQYHGTTFLGSAIVNTGLTAGEMGATTTLANYLEMERGTEALPPLNANINQVWSRPYRLMNMAEDLIEGVENVEIAEGTANGMVALAHLHKAAALGAVATTFEQGVLATEVDDRAEFHERDRLLDEAISLLSDAINLTEQTEFSTAFYNEVLGSQFDLENTLRVHIARFHLMQSNYDEAYDYANSADPSVTSMFTMDDRSQNEVYNLHSTNQLGYVAPRENFGLGELIDENDGRLDFYLSSSDATSDELGLPLDDLEGFFTSLTSDIPAYIPGEITLIKAEAQARMGGDSDDVIAYIDEIRTKTPDEDPLGIGADLPQYEGDTDMDSLLEEIFIQRSAELFLTGQRLEDSRRFDRPGPGMLNEDNERNRNFYPYPQQERQDNPNVPDDPEI